MASINEKIAGLYVAFFDRAADQNGLNYWISQARSLGEDTAVNTLAAGFSAHLKFTQLYDGLSNIEFVQAIYTNCLGNEGDSSGIGYWTSRLDSGMPRSDMVAAFVTAALDFTPDDAALSGLSQAELNLAVQRQAYLANKVSVSFGFVDTLSDLTNLDPETDPSDPAALDLDPVYSASIKILSQVTDATATAEAALASLSLLADRTDAITVINRLDDITHANTLSGIAFQDDMNSRSSTNTGLGTLSTSDTYGVAAVDSGVHWPQASQTITYSFNDTIPPEYYSYAGGGLTDNWTPLNTEQREAFRDIADQVSQLLGTPLQEIAANGQIRLNIVDTEPNVAGFSFYPASYPGYRGDFFLSSGFNTSPEIFGLNPGQEGWGIMVHELGHALGLKHPFEAPVTLPAHLDDSAHSVMSYTERYAYKPVINTGSGGTVDITYDFIEPRLFSLYDVAALQSIYGVNASTNSGDTTYSFSFSDFAIQTIWDAGGTDTLDFSHALGETVLDMREGTLNSADRYSREQIVSHFQAQAANTHYHDWIESNLSFQYARNQIYTGQNNLAIAHGTVIENIYTGSANDIITDNAVDNIIRTGDGNDAIYLGNGGRDTIDAGAGQDRLYLDVPFRDQVTVTTSDNVNYAILAPDFAVEVTGVETVHFNDSTSYDISLLV